MSKPVCLLWVNDAGTYRDALAAAGIAERFELHALNMDQPVPAELAARTEEIGRAHV